MKHLLVTLFICCLFAPMKGLKAQQPCVNYNKITHCTNGREIWRSTHYTQSANQVFYINRNRKVCRMEKHIWREFELDPGAPNAYPAAGIEWVSPNRLWYVTASGTLRYFDYQGGMNWQVSNDVTNLVHQESDLTSNDDFLFFIRGDQRVCSIELGGLGIQVMNQSAPIADENSELIWSESDNRLYYKSNQRLHALEWNGSSWQVMSTLAGDLSKFSAHLAANDDHIYYINRYNQVTEMEKSNLSTTILNTSSAAEAHQYSDLIWEDDKLFYVNNNRDLVYQFKRAQSNWVFCDEFYLSVYPDMHFEAFDKYILFAEDQGFADFYPVYVRSPLDPVEILNDEQEECWNIVPELSDEFNSQPLNLNKWTITPGWPNDPDYFLATDGSAHSLQTQGTTRFARITTSQGCWDQFGQPSTQPCHWEYKSGMMAITNPTVQPGDKVEIRCRFQKTKYMRYAFWFWTSGREIDVFELQGHGLYVPTNHHNFRTDNGVDDPVQIQSICDRDFADVWHTFAVEWDDDEIVWYYNNVPFRRVRTGQACPEVDLSNYTSGILLSCRVDFNHACAPVTFPNYFDIDYVRTYRKDQNCGGGKAASVANSNAGVKVYPNPASDFLNVVNEKGRISTVEIINLNGQVVQTSQKGRSASAAKLDVNALPAGIYFVRITTDEGIINKKVTLF